VINVAAVVWLLWSKRLFGLNAGGAAYHAEHSAESLLTVERAARIRPIGRTQRAAAAPCRRAARRSIRFLITIVRYIWPLSHMRSPTQGTRIRERVPTAWILGDDPR